MQADWLSHLAQSAGRDPDAIGADFGLFGIKIKAPKFLRKAVKTVTSPVRAVGKFAAKQSGVISRQLGRVPLVGPGLRAVYHIGPGGQINLAANIASGQRIDKAAYGALKERVKAYQDVAPYVQTVVSLVPGVGQGISGAIGAANALSKGQPITQALIEAGRGALPGGPVAAAAYDVAVAGIQGKPIDEVMLNALPIPADQKQIVVAAVRAASDIASGKRVDEAIYARGRNLLPPAARTALDTGVAIAQGQKLQQIAKTAVVAAVPQLSAVGAKAINANPMLKAGATAIGKSNPAVTQGFRVGTGFLKHKVTPTAITALRAALPPAERKGFDIAASVHMGRIIAPKTNIPPNEQFGYYATQGMQGAKPKNKVAMMKTIAVANPKIRKGAATAIKKIKGTEPTIWARVVKWIQKHTKGAKK
jgi:hypothetical protein